MYGEVEGSGDVGEVVKSVRGLSSRCVSTLPRLHSCDVIDELCSSCNLYHDEECQLRREETVWKFVFCLAFLVQSPSNIVQRTFKIGIR